MDLMENGTSRRGFLKQLVTGLIGAAAAPSVLQSAGQSSAYTPADWTYAMQQFFNNIRDKFTYELEAKGFSESQAVTEWMRMAPEFARVVSTDKAIAIERGFNSFSSPVKFDPSGLRPPDDTAERAFHKKRLEMEQEETERVIKQGRERHERRERESKAQGEKDIETRHQRSATPVHGRNLRDQPRSYARPAHGMSEARRVVDILLND